MRNDLQIIRIPTHSKEWHNFRRNGIGGSEIADICGLVKPEYNRTIYHFHNKVADVITEVPDNPKMFFGRYMEDKIADLWQYYDGGDWGYIDNFKADKKIRSCRNLNGIVVNPKYPWLFGSVDRLINMKGGFNLITGEPLKTEAILECKTLSYNASRQWEDGIPISYIAQIHIYMIILETDYAELAVLRDGNEFFVEKIQRDDALCDSLINVSRAFWENRVLPAKRAFIKKQEAERAKNYLQAEEYDAIIQRCEPEPDSSNAYTDFMNKQFLKERETMSGTMELYELCKKDKVLLGLGNILDEQRDLIKNQLIKALSEKGAEVIDFDRVGSYKWSERKGSKNRTPMNLIKEKPSEDQLMDEFNKINLDCY